MTMKSGYETETKQVKTKQTTLIKKGSFKKFLITLVLTIIAVVLIGFLVKYLQGGF